MSRTKRALIGFAVAPAVTPLIMVCWKGLTVGFYAQGLEGKIQDIAYGFLLISLFAYVAALILGLPIFVLFGYLRISSSWAYGLGGIAMAASAMLLLAITGGALFLTGIASPLIAFLHGLPIPALCGFGSALLFWRIVNGRRQAEP